MSHNQWAETIREIMRRHGIEPGEDNDGFIYDLAAHISHVVDPSYSKNVIEYLKPGKSIEKDPFEDFTKDELIHIVKSEHRRNGNIKQRIQNLLKQMEAEKRLWGKMMNMMAPSHEPKTLERHSRLLDLLISHDNAIREQLRLSGKYAISNRVQADPDDWVCGTWLAILEFMDIEDE